MTLSEMQTYLASLVDDPNQTYFTPAQTTLYLNHAAAETQKLLIQAGQNYYLSVFSFNTTANLNIYSLPDDFLKLNRLEYIQGTAPNDQVYPLFSITLNQQDQFSLYAQFPSAFYFRNNRIVLVPTPQSVCSMRMTYTYRIADMVAPTDEPDVPLEFQVYCVHVAAIECFIKDGRDPSTLFNYTKKIEEDLKREAVERAQDRAPSIVRTENEDYWGWG